MMLMIKNKITEKENSPKALKDSSSTQQKAKANELIIKGFG